MTDRPQIYIVGGGIAGLSAAVFAIRDGGLEGKDIHILEELEVLFWYCLRWSREELNLVPEDALSVPRIPSDHPDL